MGYYAAGSGDVTLKNGIEASDILEKIRKEDFDFLCNGEIEEGVTVDGQKALDIWEADDHWHEEDVMEVLNFIKPYIDAGCLVYSGDESCHWRYVFDPKTDKWVEENGRIDYNFDSYSDEELVEALKKRGYEVKKL